MRSVLLALALLAGTASSAFAQEYAVSRRAWSFFERALTIEVLADAPGALQIVRGEPGRVEVAGHARDGLAAWGLGGYRRDRLRLSALGASEADYVVIVPEDVHVSVTLPGDYLARSVSYEPAALLRWEGGAVQPAADFGVAPGILENGMYPVHRGSHGPARVELPDASSLRSIEVRVGGDEFLVASSRPLAFGPGRGPLVIRTGAEALDIVITLPRGTRSFQLHGADGDLVRLQDGQLAAACQPSIALQAPDRQSVTLRPAGGGLRCR